MKVYLSMLNDYRTALDNDSKKQILNYIFTKIETGLIKHTEDKDSGLISELLKR